MDRSVGCHCRRQRRDLLSVRQISAANRVLGLSMPFLRARNLSVEFSIYQGSSRSLKKMVFATAMQGNLGRDSADRINVRALNDVSLDIENGDRVGLIGANGAGKTTLLRGLAGIYFPTRGKRYSSGKISALLAGSI